jgi:hypothetical protein
VPANLIFGAAESVRAAAALSTAKIAPLHPEDKNF